MSLCTLLFQNQRREVKCLIVPQNMSRIDIILMIICLHMWCASSECTIDDDVVSLRQNAEKATKLKLGSIALLMATGALGVSLPLIGKKIPALQPENDIFFMVKAFAAGVILCTGFVHILPDAFQSFNSPCLESMTGKFPFPGFVAMLSAMGTLMIDTLATGYYKRQHFRSRSKQINVEEEEDGSHVQVHTHATHGHAHGSAASPPAELIRRRIVSQVLEIGIVVHSVIIGISLGASHSISTIKTLLAALSFHQFFEGLGLGGCLSLAEFKSRSTVMMAAFFSLTAPVGIGIGMGMASAYKKESKEAMVVEGMLNAASAGILIYMSLVDLLAADFMNPRLQSNLMLHLGANLSLLLGAASMSVLAIWA